MLIDKEDKEKFNIKKWYVHNGHVYLSLKVGGKRKLYKLSRLIMNCPKGMEVDHINHNKLDNRKSNLRIVTHQQNNFNRKRARNSSSIYKGVDFLPKKKAWRAKLGFMGIQYFIGEFKKERWAAMAYDMTAKELFGKFAYLNFQVV